MVGDGPGKGALVGHGAAGAVGDLELVPVGPPEGVYLDGLGASYNFV